MNVIETYVMDLLHDWYTKMRDQDKEAAAETRIKAEGNIKSIKRNKTIYIFYCLLLFRSQIFFKETISNITIEKLHSFSHEMDDYNKFFFYYFMGLNEYNQRKFKNAVDYYYLAEENIHAISDKVERAEFNYKVGAAHFQHENFRTALQYALKSLNGYEKVKGRQKRTADCKVLLGQIYSRLEQFDKATAYFKEALITYEETQDQTLLNILYQNLGILYSKQSISDKAIKYYYLSLQNNERLDYKLPTQYLLSKELFKIGERTNALYELRQGFEIARELDNKEYEYHLEILQAEYLNKENLETILVKAIDYFKENNLWEGVIEYSKKLGDIFYNKSQFKNAAIYYKLIIESNDYTYK